MYQVRRDFLPFRTALEELSPVLRSRVEKALTALESDPLPATYRCRQVEAGVYGIAVVDEQEEVSVLYVVKESEHVVELVAIKRVGVFGKVFRALDELTRFGP